MRSELGFLRSELGFLRSKFAGGRTDLRFNLVAGPRCFIKSFRDVFHLLSPLFFLARKIARLLLLLTSTVSYTVEGFEARLGK